VNEFLAILPAKDDRVVQFTDYVFENYISPDAMCPPNSSFYFTHPNIYNCINVLIEIQSETYTKCRSNGIKTKKICEKEACIRQQMTKLAQKEIEWFDFIKLLSFKFLRNQ
jgi:hypothetical protein